MKRTYITPKMELMQLANESLLNTGSLDSEQELSKGTSGPFDSDWDDDDDVVTRTKSRSVWDE